MSKVVSSKKSNVSIFKKVLAVASLVLGMGLAIIPSKEAYAEEVLFEDTSSDDVNLTDATNNETEQTNGDTTETRSEQSVNDGTVDTSAGTNPDDAERDQYNGDNNVEIIFIMILNLILIIFYNMLNYIYMLCANKNYTNNLAKLDF